MSETLGWTIFGSVLAVCLAVLAISIGTAHIKARSAERIEAIRCGAIMVEGYGPHVLPRE